jgi:ubiquinone/menaquinone biosynthesis C-methylase UbiE
VVGVGIYGDQVLPRLQDKVCGVGMLSRYRSRVCAGLVGHVLELGFGSGHNVPHYPDEVVQVSAVEPSDVGWRLASGRLQGSPVPVERAGLDGQSLPFADDVFDAALSTFTLCTIPDLPAALAEVRRVLRPGAGLHFLEHGRAPDESVRRWQSRLNPVQRRLGGGCRLDVPIDRALTDAGFRLERLDRGYARWEPPVLGYLYEGVAVG